jgi:branched-chain amino acid aminotransferase
MTSLVYLSSVGRPVAPSEAKISVFDRGFLYGDSVYETLRTSGGHLVEWELHLRRLERSAQGIALEMPFSDQALESAVQQTLEAAGNPDSRVRVVVTRGAGAIALDIREAIGPQLVVYVQPLVALPREAYEKGIGAVIVDVRRGAEVGLKTGNYLPNILALRQAIEKSGEDAIMTNFEGAVAEGATSNVFMVRQGRVLTPSLATGVLEGITRHTVLELTRGLGLEARETTIMPSELRAADELFLTSSVRGVMPVTRLDGHTVGNGTPGPVTRRILVAYQAYLASIARGGA